MNRLISIRQINQPKGCRKAPYNEAVAEQIAESVKAVGLLQPIGVRPVAGTDDRFELIFGRHRLGAYRDYLNAPEIEATIFEGFDDVDAEMAGLAENLWRNPLTRAEFLVAVKRWATLYDARHPERRNGSKAQLAAAGRTSGKAKAERASGDYQIGSRCVDETDAIPGIKDLIVATTGLSPSGASRALRIARGLSADQIITLKSKGATEGTMWRLAGIKDAPIRDRVVDLVANGTDLVSAIDSATGKGKPDVPARAVLTLAVHDDEETEFLTAIERFKAQTGRKFPTWSEVLAVVKSLGYVRPVESRRAVQ